MFDMKDSPESVYDFLSSMLSEKGRSQKTVFQYYHDLRTYGRYLEVSHGNTDEQRIGDIAFESIPDSLLTGATRKDIRGFLVYLNQVMQNKQSAVNRKLSALRSYYKYLTVNGIISVNPTDNIESPSKAKRLPKFLTLNESLELLKSVSGANYERDYAVLTLFLNCGLRVSELVGINLRDISFDQGTIRIIGKGNKERMLYLNDACTDALKKYLAVRPKNVKPDAANALFISRNHNRMSVQTVQWMIYKYLDAAGFGNRGMSVHKLRHTAATLLYREGGVDVRVLKEILGHEQLSTTQIYTHVSDDQIRSAVNRNPLAEERGRKNSQPLSLNNGSISEDLDEEDKE